LFLLFFTHPSKSKTGRVLCCESRSLPLPGAKGENFHTLAPLYTTMFKSVASRLNDNDDDDDDDDDAFKNPWVMGEGGVECDTT